MTALPSTGASWGVDHLARACAACQCRWLLPAPQATQCPWCGTTGTLSEASFRVPAPEHIRTNAASREAVARTLRRALARIPAALRPPDLDPRRLEDRLRAVFVCRWQVDSDVHGSWSCQAGFDYDVETHRERRVAGGWDVQKINRTHIDWEPRHGTLARHIDNVPAPALVEHRRIESVLGPLDGDDHRPYQPGDVAQGAVMLPNLSQAEAWNRAQDSLDEEITQLVQAACGAQHIQNVKIDARYDNQNWTLLLTPLWTTHYQDSRGAIRHIRVHGPSGAMRGELCADHKKLTLARWGTRLAAVALGAVGVWNPTGLIPPPLVVMIAAMILFLGPRLLPESAKLDNQTAG